MRDDGPDIDLESATKTKDDNRHKIDYLVGLRGLASLLVYLSHTTSWWYGPETSWEHGFGYHGEYMFATFPFVRTFYTGGAAAVTLFFVISGYCLTVAPLQFLQRGSPEKLWQYLIVAIIKRPFRLYLPAAAVSLMMVAIMHLPFGLSPELMWPKPEPNLVAELRTWLREFVFRLNFFYEHSPQTDWFRYDPPIWTMPAELGGSLALFVLLGLSTFVTTNRRAPAFFAIATILLLCGQWVLGGMVSGAIIAIYNTNNDIRPSRTTFMLSGLTHLSLFLGWFLLGQPSFSKDAELSYATPGWYILTSLTPPAYSPHRHGRFWPQVGAIMVVLAVTKLPWAKKFFRQRALCYLGHVSFALYLVHIPIVWTVGDRLGRVFGKRRFDFDTSYDNLLPLLDLGPIGISSGFLIWQAIMIPLNLWISDYITRYIDQPSIKFTKKLATQFQRYL